MTATRTLTGTQKAALVIMNLSTEHAAVVMRQFSEQEAEEITAEGTPLIAIATMRNGAGAGTSTVHLNGMAAATYSENHSTARSPTPTATRSWRN